MVLDPAVVAGHPGCQAAVVVATGVTNGPSDDATRAALAEAADAARARHPDVASMLDHPDVAPWRDAYRRFGAKPNRQRNSLESLLRRVLQPRDLPEVNALTDLYNAVSVLHGLPVGGEDLDRVEGVPRLVVAAGGEPFAMLGADGVEDAPPAPGEVVWRDDAGVTCRAWNWRQCTRTQLSTDTVNAYFLLDRLPPVEPERLDRAGADLAGRIRHRWPEAHVTVTPRVGDGAGAPAPDPTD